MIKVNWLKSLDYIGKFLLCWFVLETVIYYWSGSFFTELDDVFYLFSVESYGEALHLMFMMAVSGLVIVIMGPFLLEGKWAGILLVILYSALGNTINPFWYVFPDQWQGTSYEPTGFLSTINITWSAIVLMGMAAFFYFRRWKPVVETQTDGHIDHGSLTEEEKEKAVGE